MWKLALYGGSTERPTWLFWLDFVLYPAIVAVIAGLNCRTWQWVGLMAAGALLFTFAEYWVHRLPLHRGVYHSRHERHHTHPKEYVMFPIYFTPLVFLAFYLVLPLAVFAGFLVGYTWFLTWHHVLHHINLNNYPSAVRKYAIWHLEHHHDETCNFGITVPFWDVIFGTYRRPERG